MHPDDSHKTAFSTPHGHYEFDRMPFGLAGYYRRFIKGFSKIAKPLTNLLKKEEEFKWGEKEQECFEILKEALYPTSRLARWRIKLSEYEYEIIYKPGKINANADALSRNPITGVYPIQPDLDAIEECSEDEEARERNANPKPLVASPREGTMKEEPEPITTGMQTRNMTEGESNKNYQRKKIKMNKFMKMKEIILKEMKKKAIQIQILK
ncbi:hypothetical protein PUN28_020777 [Cardiocondyla obscurior]|uniref:Reverse transcriptase/retrotransposon-derived protein RNase H-like domain-containing protein n=1 Tax=Cardiocondyla obscurior TaxID=286306 RepID=A0AAW2EAZ1_9HYME